MTELEKIIRSGMCTGCGVCASIAGPDVLRMGPGPFGEARPWVMGGISVELDERIRSVCPGVTMRAESPERDEHVSSHPVWGPTRKAVVAFAGDPDTRFIGSSGGGLTALVQHVVASGQVDFVLQIRASTAAPLLSTRQLSQTPGEVLACAGSRYGSSSPLADLVQCLDLGRPFAVVGKPCDIAAVRNLARHDERVDALVRLTISFLCGGIGAERQEYMLEREQIPVEDITAFRCRGHGCPGPTRIEFRDGSAREYGFAEFWGEDEEHWGIPFRCKICPDAVGEQADLVAFDVWANASPTGESEGESGFIARTSAGEAVLTAAQQSGLLTVDRDLTFDDLGVLQPHHVTRREAAGPRLVGFMLRRRMIPSFPWRRLGALARARSPLAWWGDARGAWRRAAAVDETLRVGTPPAVWSGLPEAPKN